MHTATATMKLLNAARQTPDSSRCANPRRPPFARLHVCPAQRWCPHPPSPGPWLLCCCTHVAYSMPTAHAAPPTPCYSCDRWN